MILVSGTHFLLRTQAPLSTSFAVGHYYSPAGFPSISPMRDGSIYLVRDHSIILSFYLLYLADYAQQETQAICLSQLIA